MNELQDAYSREHIHKLFFVIGIIMLLGLAFFMQYVNVGGVVGVLGILVIDFFAGMTNSHRKGMIMLDILIAMVGTAYFEIVAAVDFRAVNDIANIYFLFNETLAILFFIALYVSVRTYRRISTGSTSENREEGNNRL